MEVSSGSRKLIMMHDHDGSIEQTGQFMANLPDQMTVIEIAAPGGPEQLKSARRPTPKPGEGEVLVRVAAAGVNRPDVMQRQGRYPPPPGGADLPGLEVAGEVAAIGPGVSAVAIGDRVTALLPGGG